MRQKRRDAIGVPFLPPRQRGWMCPNCKRAHAPDVKTCPVDMRPLRERIKVFND